MGGYSRGVIEIHDAKTGAVIRTFLEEPGTYTFYLDWSPDGRKIAHLTSPDDASPRDRLIKIWDVETGNVQRVLTLGRNSVRVISWAPDSIHMAHIFNNTVNIWNTATGQRIASLPHPDGELVGVDWSAGGHRIATVRGGPGEGVSRDVRIWTRRGALAQTKGTFQATGPGVAPLGFKREPPKPSYRVANKRTSRWKSFLRFFRLSK
jgi:WD40 repeat protein